MNDISPKEHYQNLKGYTPKRALEPKKNDSGVVWFTLACIALIVLWMYFIFHPYRPQIAQAAEVSHLAPELLNEKDAQCAYYELYPEKITNVKDAKADCL